MSRSLFFIACCAIAACKPASTETAADVRVVRAEPRCAEIGVVEGVGGNEKAAWADALEQAAERGATHARLDRPHPDLEDGMTMVVTGKIYRCPTPEEEFPPDGYR